MVYLHQDLAPIPPQLLGRLERSRAALERRGILQARPDGRIRLRYREYDEDLGYSKYRSLELGHDRRLVAQVGAAIAGWRAEREALEAERIRQVDAAMQAAQEPSRTGDGKGNRGLLWGRAAAAGHVPGRHSVTPPRRDSSPNGHSSTPTTSPAKAAQATPARSGNW